MAQDEKPTTTLKSERRKTWTDRRLNSERRNAVRMSHMDGECRNNVPRRSSDIAGKLIEGELWWGGGKRFFV